MRTNVVKKTKLSADTEEAGRSRTARSLSLVVGIAIVISILAPLVPLIIWSFGASWFFPQLLPPELSLRAWRYIFSPTSKMVIALWQTALIAFVAMVLSMLISVPAGRALGLYKFRGKRIIEFLVLAPTIIPVFAVVMGIDFGFIRLGLAGTLLGVVLVHLIPTTPYTVMVMSSVFANYEPEYEEQARTLGASPLRTFTEVTFPAIFPGLLVAGMFAFIISWGQYILTLMIGGGQVVTLPLLLFAFASGGDHSVTAALSVLYLAPSILILVITSKYLTGEGAAMGGYAP